MLMQAALKAFVPKETAEKVQLAIEGMLRDGTLDGIGSLVSDIQEIKQRQARIEFGLGKIFAMLQDQQRFFASGADNGLPGSATDGHVNFVAPNERSISFARPGSDGVAGGEPDGLRSGDAQAAE